MSGQSDGRATQTKPRHEPTRPSSMVKSREGSRDAVPPALAFRRPGRVANWVHASRRADRGWLNPALARTG